MKTVLRFLILIGLFVLVWPTNAFSQTSAKSKSVDFLGSVANGVYSNDFFGFKITVSKDWKLVSQETTAATLQVGTDSLKDKDGRSIKAIEDSVKTEVVLLHFSKKPIGSVENAMFMLAVLKQPSPSVLPSMVAEATKSVVLKSPSITLVKDTREKTIAGRRFALIDFAVNVNSQRAEIKYYVTVSKGYALTFSLSYVAEKDLQDLEAVMASLEFLNK